MSSFLYAELPESGTGILALVPGIGELHNKFSDFLCSGRSRVCMKKFKLPLMLLIGVLLGLLTTPRFAPVRGQVDWQISKVMADIKYAISPPEEVIFVPRQNSIPETGGEIPLLTVTVATAVPKVMSSATPSPAYTPAATPTPIPKKTVLSGFKHEYQEWNNCGPATLAIALSYWGWKGSQEPIAAFAKPNPRDKNVMPYELTAYVEEETEYEVVSRVGGNIDLLKRFLAAGLPVMIEKGMDLPKDGWMGHYVLATGYNDADSRFTLQDSYFGPDQIMTYDDLVLNWRAFDFQYLVIYPSDKRADIEAILGPYLNEDYSFQSAAALASGEIYSLSGRDQFFAWYNRGTSLMRLQDYDGAAAAYDQAFSLYPAIPEKQRPWRMVWYQTGPYWAYYYTGRYQDVIDLATKTLGAMSEPVLEESYYWRALARESLGDTKGAIKDLRSSLQYHSGFEPGVTKLRELGRNP